MMRWKLGSAFALGMAALSAAGHVSLPARADEAAWLTDYEGARAAARQAGKPLFVVFR